MGHYSIRLKVRRRKVANLAAYSRQHTVNNCTIPKKTHPYKWTFYSWDKTTRVGKFDVCTYGKKFGVDEEGHYHRIDTDNSWPHERHEQPKSLRKKYKKKYYNKGTHDIRKIVTYSSDYDLLPKKPSKKMNRVEFMERLTQAKLAKWEAKNPKPMEMFRSDIEKWNQERLMAEERLRNFVVSIYDKLPLVGRFESKPATYVEEKVAEIKDIDGDGHKVNELTEDSKLLKKAQKITNRVKAKRNNLICTNLKDHKRQRGRIILPKAA